MKISTILTCAGNGCRFGHNKLIKPLCGKPVFIRTVEQFYRVKEIDEIIIAVRKDEMNYYQKWLNKEKLPAKLVVGGEQRYISAYNGVKQSKGDYVLIHDGDRPLVSLSLIKKIVAEVKQHQAVMTATKAYTCVKYVKSNFVEQCLPRAHTWLGQTPHAFKREIIIKAYKKAIKDKNFIGMDDCDFVSRLGIKVKVVPGDIYNIKITYPSDLIIVRHLYKKLRKEQDGL